MSTIPASGARLSNSSLEVPHPMIVGDDNILYIGNGKNVASLNGTSGANGTFNSSALDLPDGYIITSFAKTRNFLVIFAYRPVSGGSNNRSDATAFFWDYVSDSFTYAYSLPGFYVNGGFSYKGTVGCFVSGVSFGVFAGTIKRLKLLIFNGDIFEIVANFGNVTETIPGHGGVEISENAIFWNSSGRIYQYGPSIVGLSANLNSISVLDGTTREGMLKFFNSSSFYGSSGTVANGGLEKLLGSFYPGNFYTPYITPPFGRFLRGRIKEVKVHWAEVTSGGHSIALKINTAKGNTPTTIVTGLSTITAETLITRYDRDSSGAPLPIFDSLQLEGTYTNVAVGNVPPVLESVEIYYENVNIGIN
jgi:hypothetical protein